jgi:hypothetical protein
MKVSNAIKHEELRWPKYRAFREHGEYLKSLTHPEVQQPLQYIGLELIDYSHINNKSEKINVYSI